MIYEITISRNEEEFKYANIVGGFELYISDCIISYDQYLRDLIKHSVDTDYNADKFLLGCTENEVIKRSVWEVDIHNSVKLIDIKE